MLAFYLTHADVFCRFSLSRVTLYFILFYSLHFNHLKHALLRFLHDFDISHQVIAGFSSRQEEHGQTEQELRPVMLSGLHRGHAKD